MYKIKRFSMLDQKEFAGANTLLKLAKNNPSRNAIVSQAYTPSQFGQAVKNSYGTTNPIPELAKDNRNKMLGARTIDQVNNIANNHFTRLTPKRTEIINNAKAAREAKSTDIFKTRRSQLDMAKSITNFNY